MSLPIELKAFLEAEIQTLNLNKHPYFRGLIDGQISKEKFINTQIQFSYLVKYFSRPMAAVIANIPNDRRRMVIVDNLWEEHGKGNPDKIHGKTILTLIERLGGDLSILNEDHISPSIQIFNTALRGISTFEDYRVSTAVFGGIERSFVDISSLICQGIIKRGWLPEGQITHYSLHKELDIQHAEDFLAVAADDWSDTESQKMMKRGMCLGVALFTQVYTDFAHACA